jgi:hypothetical protein
MRPSVALLGFLLGSSGAICFGLMGVAIVFWRLGPDYPELQAEIGPLFMHLGRFCLLTVVAGASFYGLLRQRPWRQASIVILTLTLGGILWSYLAAGG